MATANGLIVLSKPLGSLQMHVKHLLEHAASVISGTLYIHLQPAINDTCTDHNRLLTPLSCTTEVLQLINHVYDSDMSICKGMDIRILLGHVFTSHYNVVPQYRLEKPISVVMSDVDYLVDQWNSCQMSTIQLIHDTFNVEIRGNVSIERMPCFEELYSVPTYKPPSMLSTYDNVVVGGTFDRLHNGHKLLLSHGCLVCDKKLTVGVTSPAMNSNKLLKELILPWAEREKAVKDFIMDIKPNILLEVLPIDDMYGPTIHRDCFQCLVVSQETESAVDAVNAMRKERGYDSLKFITVDVLENSSRLPDEEKKLSSSSHRKRLLGQLLCSPSAKPHLPPTPYRIGLTGGIASGKSTMCRELESLGADIVNCDAMGSEAYKPGTQTFDAVVNEFGPEVISGTGDINKKILGAIVFSNKRSSTPMQPSPEPKRQRIVVEEYKERDFPDVIMEGVSLLSRFFAFIRGSKAAKAADFYSGDFSQRGIENLVEHWEEVVNNIGEYIID